MAKLIDLTGQRFGHLTVLEYAGVFIYEYSERTIRLRTWKCRCDCGNEVVIRTSFLTNGTRTSCGCKQFRKHTPRKALDITGMKYGFLTARYPSKDKQGYWHCRCDCGNEKEVPKGGLIRGDYKSCGADIHRVKDLTGQVFGRLTVLEFVEIKNHYAKWRCRCECGNEIILNSRQLVSGKKNCGCDKAIDLTGRRVGMLTVLYRTEEKRNGSVMWMCKCDCGNTTLVRAEHIQRNAIKSCGCRLNSAWDITGEKRGHLTALRNTGKKDDRGNSIYEWQCDCGNIIERSIWSTSGKKSLQCPECRKKLYRRQCDEMREGREINPDSGLAMNALNSILDGKLTKNNSSGVRGVHWNESKKTWEVTGRENGKPVYLGSYKDINEARELRERFVHRVYGKRKEENE